MVDDTYTTITIESENIFYLIGKGYEYMCIILNRDLTICTMIRHSAGLIILEIHTGNRAIRKIYTTLEKKAAEIMEDFEKLAEIMLDNASIIRQEATHRKRRHLRRRFKAPSKRLKRRFKHP